MFGAFVRVGGYLQNKAIVFQSRLERTEYTLRLCSGCTGLMLSHIKPRASPYWAFSFLNLLSWIRKEHSSLELFSTSIEGVANINGSFGKTCSPSFVYRKEIPIIIKQLYVSLCQCKTDACVVYLPRYFSWPEMEDVMATKNARYVSLLCFKYGRHVKA